jgi:hypothetical protein
LQAGIWGEEVEKPHTIVILDLVFCYWAFETLH